MTTYIYQRAKWPKFFWDQELINPLLTEVRHRQGRLLGRMESIGFTLQAEANLHTLTLDVLKSSEIEGEILNPDQVRSSIARRLGMDIAGMIEVTDRHLEGVVGMMLDATQNYDQLLSDERLFSWHAAMFPTGRTGMLKIMVGRYRDNTKEDPMQVVSGAIGREKVHFEAPVSELLENEMNRLFEWFNKGDVIDPVIKAAIAHLWFVTVHPFDDGNGRIARAITDMQLSRADQNPQRFYSMSSQIRLERKSYYDVLEKTQKADLDITLWVEWFLNCLANALKNTEVTLAVVLKKAKFWEKHVATILNDRQRKIINMMLDGFDGKLTSTKWAVLNKCSQDTAGRDINDLIHKNILIKEPGGGRSTRYLLAEI